MRPASTSCICLRMYWLDALFVFPALSRHFLYFAGTLQSWSMSFEPDTPTTHGCAESAQPLKRNPKQKIQYEANAQNTRWCMPNLLAGPMMSCGLWPPPCGVHHAARLYFLHLPPHVLAGCPICISCFVQALHLCFRYPAPQTPTTRGLVPAAIKR